MNFPKGENRTSLEQIRQQVLEEMEKTEGNGRDIERGLQTTFALWRQEVVTGDHLVRDIWFDGQPCLKFFDK